MRWTVSVFQRTHRLIISLQLQPASALKSPGLDGNFFRSSPNEPARGLNKRGVGLATGSGSFPRVGSGAGSGPLSPATSGALGQPIGRSRKDSEGGALTSNGKSWSGQPANSIQSTYKAVTGARSPSFADDATLASAYGPLGQKASTQIAPFLQASGSRPPESEGLSGSSWAARWKRDRQPGEMTIGPPADHSGGFGRGKQISDRAKVSDPMPFNAHGLTKMYCLSQPGPVPPSKEQLVAASAAAVAREQLSSQRARKQMEDMEDEAKILAALRLEEEERQAARQIDGWSPAKAMWFYKDYEGRIQGPFNASDMQEWYAQSYLKNDLLVRREEEEEYRTLGEVIAEIGNSNEPFLVAPPKKPEPVAAPPEQAPPPPRQQQQQQQHQHQQQQQQHQPWDSNPMHIGSLGGFQDPMAMRGPSGFGASAGLPFGGAGILNHNGANMPGEMSLEEKLRQQEQYILMMQRQQLIEQQMRGIPIDPRLLASIGGLPSLSQQQAQQQPWNGALAPTNEPWQQQPSGSFDGNQGYAHHHAHQHQHQQPQPPPQQQQHPHSQPLHQRPWDGRPQHDPWGTTPAQQQQQHQGPHHEPESRPVPGAIGTPIRSGSPVTMEDASLPSDQRRSSEAPHDEQAHAAPEGPTQEELGDYTTVERRTKVKTLPDEEESAEGPQTSNANMGGNLSLATEEQFRQAQSGSQWATQNESEVATPSTPSKPAPWAAATEDRPASASGPSLRDIQAAELKAAEAKRLLEKQAAANRARAAAGSASSTSQPINMSWGLASVPSTAAKSSDNLASPVGSAGVSAWNTTAPAAKKTLAEIQEEEQKRAEKARQIAAAARANAGVGAGGKGYADTATRHVSQPTVAPTPGWSVVGSAGKPTTPVASPSSRPPGVAAPQRSASTSVLPPKPAPAVSAAALAPSRSSTTPVQSSSGPSPEFIRYLKDQLKGLNVKQDDFIEMLMSFPLDPSPDVVEIIAESVYANSGTMDGRRFAADFVAKRKMDAQGRSPTSATKQAPSASDVLKSQPAKKDTFSGFQVVGKSKKKGGK